MSELTSAQRAQVAPYVSNTTSPVFVLRLPPSVSGALFARYSRSPHSLRRLLLSEFLNAETSAAEPDQAEGVNRERARDFHERVIGEYGDDSVMQLASISVAFEGVSNVVTKVIEWGRLASYLEQSTRYIDWSDRPNGAYRYHVPDELDGAIRGRYVAAMDELFVTYGALLAPMVTHCDRVMTGAGEPASVRGRAVKARALDALRGLLPAATTSHLGMHGSAQAYEALIHRLCSHPLSEARTIGAQLTTELRKEIPEFLTRVDRPDRGGVTQAYLAERRHETAEAARGIPEIDSADPARGVRLVEWDPDGEMKVLTAALWEHGNVSYAAAERHARNLSDDERRHLCEAIVGVRENRRHKPGRAFEHASYLFEVTCDYGAYRDLQRHRLLTLHAQPLGVSLGAQIPGDIEDAGHGSTYRHALDVSRHIHDEIAADAPTLAPYAVSMAHRVRFLMRLNAREAMHLIELRSQPQGHQSYRRVALAMHEAIRDHAGHRAIAGSMQHVAQISDDSGRLEAERRAAERRSAS